MSKFKGKFTKKKEFEGERSSFDKDRGERRKSSSKDKATKYRKKNFRDFGGPSDDEDGSRRSAPNNDTINSKNRSGGPGSGQGSLRQSGSRSQSSGVGERREGRNRTGEGAQDRNQNKGEFKPGRNKRGAAKPSGGSEKPFAGKGARKAEPPVYENFSTLPGARKKVSAEERNIRLNKFIADAGVCSRREADKLIEAGEIKVNGETVTELGYKVSRVDVVTHNGRKLKPEKLVYVLLNKPKDFLTTVDDPEDRKTVMNLVENACDERIYPVGRLDRNTTGLLLLTNDGDLAKKLTHPSHNIKKIYQVDLDKPIEEEDVEKLRAGVVLEDGEAKVDEVAVLSEDRTILGVEIHIGRNRIVRRLFEHLGYEVIRLDRVMFAGLTKKDLPRGKWRYLSEKELIRLKHFK